MAENAPPAPDANPAIQIVVPDALHHPHELVRLTKEYLETATASSGSGPRQDDKKQVLDIEVSRQSRGRALRIMDALIKAWESRGGTVTLGRGWSDATKWCSYFGIGFGLATEPQKAAILWFYNHCGLKQIDEKQNTPFDTPTPYPHLAIVPLVNWPFGTEERNPGDVLPHAYRDTKWGFYAWRNRWQDTDDIVISILTKTSKGNYSAKGEKSLTVWGLGKKATWGTITGRFTGDYKPAADGSTVLATGDGSCLAIDFSRASGCDGLLAMTGTGAPKDNVVEAGDTKVSFLFLGKAEAPKPIIAGNKITLGKQTVSMENGRIVLGVRGSPGQ